LLACIQSHGRTDREASKFGDAPSTTNDYDTKERNEPSANMERQSEEQGSLQQSQQDLPQNTQDNVERETQVEDTAKFLEDTEGLLARAERIFKSYEDSGRTDYIEDRAKCLYYRGHLLARRALKHLEAMENFVRLLPDVTDPPEEDTVKAEQLSKLVHEYVRFKENAERLLQKAIRMRKMLYGTYKHPEVIECVVPLLQLFVADPQRHDEVTCFLLLRIVSNK
jgi:hypothetical protein